MSPRRLSTLILLITLTIALLARDASVAGTWGKPDALAVWVFDVGQGDAILIDGPEHDVVIDGGGSSAITEKLARVLPWWQVSLHATVNTHPHADHLVGLIPILERYRVQNIFDPGQGYGSLEYAEYLDLAGEHRQSMTAGDVIDLGNGATLTALYPAASYDEATLEDPNDGSIILELEYGDFSMLFTGDAGVEEEHLILSAVGDIDVLKVGHHGSRTSTSAEFLEDITPEIAVMSLGEGNDYGHPHTETLQKLNKYGIEIYRTDLHGDIRFFSTGGEPTVSLFDL